MKRTFVIAGAICIAIGVGLAVVLPTLPWGSDSRRGGMMGDMDRHFVEQMIPHHEDAVAMADLALVRAEHSELRQLAGTIKSVQSREIDQMEEWYAAWYGADVQDGAFGSSGRRGGMMGSDMMGGATDLEGLASSPSFDREFIEQMIPHHQMGVMMARMVLGRSDRPEIQELARSIIAGQTAEIAQMQEWYEQWYGK